MPRGERIDPYSALSVHFPSGQRSVAQRSSSPHNAPSATLQPHFACVHRLPLNHSHATQICRNLSTATSPRRGNPAADQRSQAAA